MSTAGVTTTGQKEFEAAVENLPNEMTLALRAVAFRVSRTVHADMRKRFEAQIHDQPPKAVVFTIDEEADKQQFVIDVAAAPDKPANLPLWLERGTVHMRARPYARPALKAADAEYRSEMERVSLETARKVMG